MRLLPLFVASAAGAVVARNHEQVLLVKQSLEHIAPDSFHKSKGESNRPSIGVHFTSSNAIAAARYPNGTILGLEKVEGDAEYIDLMSRWMMGGDSKTAWKTRQGDRDSCKTHTRRYISGKPYDAEPCNHHQRQNDVDTSGNRDVAILSKLVKRVRISVETGLGIQLTNLAPTFFALQSNQTQIVQDALESVGLQSTHSVFSTKDDVLLDTTAAYAGTGALLCKDWMDLKRCRSERSAAHDSTVLFLEFNDNSFRTSVQKLRSDTTSSTLSSQLHSPELGWWNLPVFEKPRAKFWWQIHEAIAGVVSALGRETIDKIVLMGKHGTDEEFTDVVAAAVWSALEVDVKSLLHTNKTEDAERIASRGAAEMAWRREYWRSKINSYGANR